MSFPLVRQGNIQQPPEPPSREEKTKGQKKIDAVARKVLEKPAAPAWVDLGW